MSALWPLLLALACADKTPGNSDTGGATDSAVDTGPPASVAPLSLRRVASGTLAGTEGVADALVSPSNDHTYLLEADGHALRYLTNSYLEPTGEYCLRHADCAGSPDWIAGRIAFEKLARNMCLDAQGGRVFLPLTGGRVAVIDVSPDGPDAYTYQQPMQLLELPSSLMANGTFTGPCAYVPGDDALLMTDMTDGKLALLDIGSQVVRTLGNLGAQPGNVFLLSGGTTIVVALPTVHSLARVSLPDLEVERLVLPVPVADLAVDPQSGRAWVAHGIAPGLSQTDLLDPELILSSVDGVADDTHHVIHEATTDSLVAISGDATSTLISLIQGGTVVDQDTVEAEFVEIAMPSTGGDVVIFTHATESPDGDTGTGEELEPAVDFLAYDLWRTERDPTDPPPLNAFLFTAIEKPIDSELEGLIEGTSACGEFMNTYVSLVRENAAALAALDIPVAVGITKNFTRGAEICGHSDILQTLADHGFELGYMVHNRPCYNCTNEELGSNPDQCTAGHDFFCSALGSGCCFPDDPDYCAMGDQDCYQAFLDVNSAYVDGALPTPAQFVIGADRHGMWGWDWVQGYLNMARADGGRGFDLTGFAHLWTYTDQVGFSDARGKNPAPWRIDHGNEVWSIGYQDSWDQDSAFSDLVYLPGMNTSTLKLGESQLSGLFMLDFFETGIGVVYGQSDFDVLDHVLRGVLNRRTRTGPNSWYFHIHDLANVNLSDASGTELIGAPLLRDWLAHVTEAYVDTGHLQWAFPTEIRAQWSDAQ
jgi:hypothetical protein